MAEICVQYFKSDFGELKIGVFKNQLCMLDWRYRKMRTTVDSRISSHLDAKEVESTTELGNFTIDQVNEYFSGLRNSFEVPLLLVGTDFQKQVWNELYKIPFGKTKSYLELAKALNNEGAIRAVASANGANAISILIPCHRIIGKDGSLTGYAGGLEVKSKLLKLEGALYPSAQYQLFN